jgi:hypothetical protein
LTLAGAVSAERPRREAQSGNERERSLAARGQALPLAGAFFRRESLAYLGLEEIAAHWSIEKTAGYGV